MRHDISVESFGVRLRPVTLADAEFIVNLRNSPEALGRVGDTPCDVNIQRQWIESYFQRPGDYYFIVETMRGAPVGTIGIYNVREREGEWGRWIICPTTHAALPSVINLYDIAFGALGLSTVVGKVVSTNTPVISFHRRFGMQESGVERATLRIAGVPVDLVTFRLEISDWPAIRRRNAALARIAEQSLNSCNG